jgi:exodeoxyribonuclease VII large subunit
MRAVDAAATYPVVSVSRLSSYLGRKLSDDPKLRRLGVRGEVTGYTTLANGNVYFDLKDRDALIKCVVWSVAAGALPPIANGQEIVAIGSVGTFPKRSTYQLIVVGVEDGGGLGRLHAVYEELKRRLQTEGLFATERKRALPRFPFRVGLVSSRTANGAGDFRTQAAARAPHVRIELFETPVQGDGAAPDIVRALDRASRAPLDIVVLARGGGSYEDLFVFNDERVVRALARCAHPTVSAIGHEADAPLTDFVADHRAPTPSTAAQTILPLRTELLRGLERCTTALDRSLQRTLERTRGQLQQIEVRSPLWSPQRLVLPRRQRIDAATGDVERAIDARMRRARATLAALDARLEKGNPSLQLGLRRERLRLATYRLTAAAREMLAIARRRLGDISDQIEPASNAALARRRTAVQLRRAMLDGRDPTRILQRGYAIVTIDGRAVRDAAAVVPGTVVRAQLARGRLDARVEAAINDDGQ